jgi:hypothetical protein
MPRTCRRGVEGYATRTVDRLAAQAAGYGPATGTYARRLLDGDAPWMMMRSVYRLIGLAKRYGPQAAEAACARALDVDVINVSKIESMLKNATENTPAAGLARSPVMRPSTPPQPGCGCRSSTAAATPPAAVGPDLPSLPPGSTPPGRGGAAHHPFPVFFHPLFFSRAEKKKKKKGLCHDQPDP